MFVPTSDTGPKKYFCKYCGVHTQKFERHLRIVHKKEDDVKKFLAFPVRKFFLYLPIQKIVILKKGNSVDIFVLKI